MQAINKIILGTVQFGMNYGINNSIGKPDADKVIEILESAYAKGVKILDSAEAYGDAHQLIGAYHRKNPDALFNIITKVPKDFHGEDIETKVLKYIDMLNVPYLDTLMFHAFSTFKDNPAYLSNLLLLKEKGVIKKIGISIYTNEEFAEVVEIAAFDVIQIPYNLFDNWTLRGDIIKKAKQKGKIIHTRSAFLQGLFYKSPNDEGKLANIFRDELTLINEIAAKENTSIASLSLNYCIQNEFIDNVLIGVDSMDQLKENLSIAGEKISSSALENIDNIKIKDIKLLNPSLWN